MKTTYKKRNVSFKTGKGKLSVSLNPGQFLFGRNSAAEALGDSPSTVWKRMKKLEEFRCISIQSNRQYSVVSIRNWTEYQPEEEEKVTSKELPSDYQVTTKELPSDTNKKVKKDKKDKITTTTDRPVFISAELWNELLKNRTYKKLQNTPLALKTFCNSLEKAMEAGYTVEECIGEYVACSWKRFDHTWMKKDNGNGKPQTQKERHNDIREQYARDLLTKKFGDDITGNGGYEKLGN